MHELGIARDICAAVKANADGRRTNSVTVRVGILAGVAVDALDFCIHEVARDMGLGEPRIVIENDNAAMRCACGHDYAIADMMEPCPSCGGYNREILSGMDIVITEVDLEREAK